jgi:hypothetical protein
MVRFSPAARTWTADSVAWPQSTTRTYPTGLTQRLTPGLAGYLVLIIAGLFIPTIAVIGYLAIAIYYIVPTRRLTARVRRKLRRYQRPNRAPGREPGEPAMPGTSGDEDHARDRRA